MTILNLLLKQRINEANQLREKLLIVLHESRFENIKKQFLITFPAPCKDLKDLFKFEQLAECFDKKPWKNLKTIDGELLESKFKTLTRNISTDIDYAKHYALHLLAKKCEISATTHTNEYVANPINQGIDITLNQDNYHEKYINEANDYFSSILKEFDVDQYTKEELDEAKENLDQKLRNEIKFARESAFKRDIIRDVFDKSKMIFRFNYDYFYHWCQKKNILLNTQVELMEKFINHQMHYYVINFLIENFKEDFYHKEKQALLQISTRINKGLGSYKSKVEEQYHSAETMVQKYLLTLLNELKDQNALFRANFPQNNQAFQTNIHFENLFLDWDLLFKKNQEILRVIKSYTDLNGVSCDLPNQLKSLFDARLAEINHVYTFLQKKSQNGLTPFESYLQTLKNIFNELMKYADYQFEDLNTSVAQALGSKSYQEDQFSVMPLFSEIEELTENEVETVVTQTLQHIQEKLENKIPNDTMGGTCAIICLRTKDKLIVINVGDSIVFCKNNQQVEAINNLHTYALEAEKTRLDQFSGIDKKPESSNPHVIYCNGQMPTRTIGNKTAHHALKVGRHVQNAKPEITSYDIKEGDQFIIASDGIYNMKEGELDWQQLKFLGDISSFELNAKKILNLRLQQLAGKRADNLTVICLKEPGMAACFDGHGKYYGHPYFDVATYCAKEFFPAFKTALQLKVTQKKAQTKNKNHTEVLDCHGAQNATPNDNAKHLSLTSPQKFNWASLFTALAGVGTLFLGGIIIAGCILGAVTIVGLPLLAGIPLGLFVIGFGARLIDEAAELAYPSKKKAQQISPQVPSEVAITPKSESNQPSEISEENKEKAAVLEGVVSTSTSKISSVVEVSPKIESIKIENVIKIEKPIKIAEPVKIENPINKEEMQQVKLQGSFFKPAPRVHQFHPDASIRSRSSRSLKSAH